MNKKILIIILSLVCVIACALGFAACDNQNDDNPPERALKLLRHNTKPV